MDSEAHLTEKYPQLYRGKLKDIAEKGGRFKFCVMSGTVSGNCVVVSVIIVTAKCNKIQYLACTEFPESHERRIDDGTMKQESR
jgi:hypothetical protein